LNKREATRLAKERYGPTASAIAVSSRDRNQRKGIAIIEPGGYGGNPLFVVLGYGGSFEDAFRMASENPRALEAELQWKKSLEEWEKFKNDPQAAVDDMKDELRRAYNGRDQASQRTEGGSDQRADDGDQQEQSEAVSEVQGSPREG